MYIPEEAVRSTLRFVATESAPGSSVVLDGKRKSFIDWVRANIASPEKVPQALRPTLAFQKGLPILANPGYLDFPTDEKGSFSRALDSTLANYFHKMGVKPRSAILHAVMAASRFRLRHLASP